MKYLLTGGAGFIGSHLSDFLLKQGHEVTIIDDFSSGNFDNITSPPKISELHIIADSVLNLDILNDFIPKVDYIMHLAAVVGVELVLHSPIKTIETNIKGTSNVLEVANKYKKPVMLFSTSEVYGKSNAEKFMETDDLSMGSIFKERWSYAASKIVDEYLGMAYAKERWLPVTIVRLFNVVGPRQTSRYGMVMPRFISQALSGAPITVYGDGKQIRTFTHVKDVAEMVYRLAISRVAATGKVFNIGSDQIINIKSLAKVVKWLTKSDSPIEYVPYKAAYSGGFEDTKCRVPDMTHTTSCIEYTATRNLNTMIRDIANYQKEYMLKGIKKR